MGKVGTSTVSEFFKRKRPELISYHLHYLSNHWIKEVLPALNPIFHPQIKDAEEALKRIAALPKHRIKIITMVREPLDREISIIFENGKGMFNVNSINDIPKDVLFRYLDENKYENALTWFDTEFKAFAGFDIYAVPFNKKLGYSIYKTEKADILCMTTEKINGCIQQAMKEFVGMRLAVPPTANRSDEKEGKELYRQLKMEYKLPTEKFNLLYNSKYVRHFYSDDEIDAFVNKWSRGKMKYSDIRYGNNNF